MTAACHATATSALICVAPGQRCGKQRADRHGHKQPATHICAQPPASLGARCLSFAFLSLLARFASAPLN